MQQLKLACLQPHAPLRIGIWLSDGFDFYALARTLEPLRLANQKAGYAVCQWQTLSQHGGDLKASNGIAVNTAALVHADALDIWVTCVNNAPRPPFAALHIDLPRLGVHAVSELIDSHLDRQTTSYEVRRYH